MSSSFSLDSSSRAALAHVDNHAQIAIHPIHRSRRQLRNRPFAVVLHWHQALRQPDLDLPSRRVRCSSLVKPRNRQLARIAARNELAQAGKIRTLIGRHVQPGQDSLSVLDDVEVKRDRRSRMMVATCRGRGWCDRRPKVGLVHLLQILRRLGDTVRVCSGRFKLWRGAVWSAFAQIVSNDTRDVPSDAAGAVATS